jgi:chromate reductase
VPACLPVSAVGRGTSTEGKRQHSYNQDDDHHQAPAVQRLRGEVGAATGVIFVTPEYNRSVPSVLKNAIDHASRPYGASAWTGKPAGVIGVSEGALGTALAQQHLRNILASLNMPTLALPEVFIHADGRMFDDVEHGEAQLLPLLKDWMERYIAWVKLFSEG